MNKIEQIDEYADETEQPLLLLGGDDKEEFEPAIIGIAHRFGGECYVAYDYDMVIDVFAKQMSQEELDEDKLFSLQERINEIFSQNSLNNILKYSNLRKIIQSFFD